MRLFEENLEETKTAVKRVAIVGGSSRDPEVTEIIRKFPKASIHYLGIENYGGEANWINFDLNQAPDLNESFDLVVCSQVLEHVWNLENAFKGLANIITPEGHIWVNCPASNIAHGSPDYYSAGYSPDFISLNFDKNQVDCVIKGCIGSKRYYLATHYLRLWASSLEHKNPLTGYRIAKPITAGKVLEMFQRLPGRLLMATWNATIKNDISYATETYFLGTKRGSANNVSNK